MRYPSAERPIYDLSICPCELREGARQRIDGRNAEHGVGTCSKYEDSI